MPFPQFDRSKLRIQPLAEAAARPHARHPPAARRPGRRSRTRRSRSIGQRLREAKARGAARILMMGAHVLRAGAQLHLIDLMERGLVTHIAMNGAGPIHDWEFALIGATTESVARYVRPASSACGRRPAG